jgi:hypothetical protein
MATTSLFPFSPSQKQDAATVAASIVRECIDATATLVAIALAVGSLALWAVIIAERVQWLGRPPEGSVHAQLARVLFIVGRSGLLLGIGEALQDEYALVEGQLPNRLAVLLKQLEGGSLEEALTRHPSMRAA